ncbi:MAG: tetraacyldisaccharide 4'-kinase [Bacteroidales bacterium]|nr:tetraacyldisaccharide 4'-kinase [Bacteroidales bacterium]
MAIDKILLAPYWLALKARHHFYDKGWKKIVHPEIPTICIGNVTVGGTGKTPHTEMVVRMLLGDGKWRESSIAILSRGYKRRSKGFQQVTADGSAAEYGDEPLQMKKKFPQVTVAVDRKRSEGCDFLAHPEKLATSKKGRKCVNRDFPAADIVIMDDAFQHRSIEADLNILLVDYARPVFKDMLMPLGHLRDLPERAAKADVIIITKCPPYMDEWELEKWAVGLGLKNFSQKTYTGINSEGREQILLFSCFDYVKPEPVFEKGNQRYTYGKRLILFSGIANDKPLQQYLSSDYKIVRHFKFPDHHRFSKRNMVAINKASAEYPTAIIATTEKDSTRIADCRWMPESLKERMFRVPIVVRFIEPEMEGVFRSLLFGTLDKVAARSGVPGENFVLGSD